MMQRQVPTWVAVVAIVVVLVVVALVYMMAQRRAALPPESGGTLPPQPGQVKGGSPYEKPTPPGAPPFMKQRGGQ